MTRAGLETLTRLRLDEDRAEREAVAALDAQGYSSTEIAVRLRIDRPRAKQLVGQTKRGIVSVSAKAYARISAESERRKMPISQIVERAQPGVAVKRRHYSVSVGAKTSARIAARCAESGFFRSAIVEDACSRELQEGERLLEERRLVKERT